MYTHEPAFIKGSNKPAPNDKITLPIWDGSFNSCKDNVLEEHIIQHRSLFAIGRRLPVIDLAVRRRVFK